jgi:hypothetical protein
MFTARRWTSRLLWAVCVLVAASPEIGAADSASPPASTPMVSTDSGEASLSRYPSGRIRKLHLVRPDLIPYPLTYEIVC